VVTLFVFLLRRPGQKYAEHWCVAQSDHTDCVDVSFASLLIQQQFFTIPTVRTFLLNKRYWNASAHGLGTVHLLSWRGS